MCIAFIVAPGLGSSSDANLWQIPIFRFLRSIEAHRCLTLPSTENPSGKAFVLPQGNRMQPGEVDFHEKPQLPVTEQFLSRCKLEVLQRGSPSPCRCPRAVRGVLAGPRPISSCCRANAKRASIWEVEGMSGINPVSGEVDLSRIKVPGNQ